MKYAIIADIHANLEALQVVLEDTKSQKCTHYVCLGDVVGYNANPKECLDIVRDAAMPCVKGNHDEYCSTETNLEGFNPHAAEAIQWTRQQLIAMDEKFCRAMERAIATGEGRRPAGDEISGRGTCGGAASAGARTAERRVTQSPCAGGAA